MVFPGICQYCLISSGPSVNQIIFPPAMFKFIFRSLLLESSTSMASRLLATRAGFLSAHTATLSVRRGGKQLLQERLNR